jgi:hypothetical protein
VHLFIRQGSERNVAQVEITIGQEYVQRQSVPLLLAGFVAEGEPVYADIRERAYHGEMRAHPNKGVSRKGFPRVLPSNTLLLLGHEDTSSSKVYTAFFLAQKMSIHNTISLRRKYGVKFSIIGWKADSA